MFLQQLRQFFRTPFHFRLVPGGEKVQDLHGGSRENQLFQLLRVVRRGFRPQGFIRMVLSPDITISWPHWYHHGLVNLPLFGKRLRLPPKKNPSHNQLVVSSWCPCFKPIRNHPQSLPFFLRFSTIYFHPASPKNPHLLKRPGKNASGPGSKHLSISEVGERPRWSLVSQCLALLDSHLHRMRKTYPKLIGLRNSCWIQFDGFSNFISCKTVVGENNRIFCGILPHAILTPENNCNHHFWRPSMAFPAYAASASFARLEPQAPVMQGSPLWQPPRRGDRRHRPHRRSPCQSGRHQPGLRSLTYWDSGHQWTQGTSHRVLAQDWSGSW